MATKPTSRGAHRRDDTRTAAALLDALAETPPVDADVLARLDEAQQADTPPTISTG